jgi:hypothetical protein
MGMGSVALSGIGTFNALGITTINTSTDALQQEIQALSITTRNTSTEHYNKKYKH